MSKEDRKALIEALQLLAGLKKKLEDLLKRQTV